VDVLPLREEDVLPLRDVDVLPLLLDVDEPLLE
jgi:hypothetical protein